MLPGRGETAALYARFGKRLSADAYKVRVVPVDLADLDDATDRVGKLLADESLPAPKVLVGSDSGATLAALLAPELPVDAVVLAGLALPSSAGVGSWADEVEARTACPVHSRVIDEDASFERGALNQPLPWSSVDLAAPDKPLLVLHGSADRVTPAADAFAPFAGAADAARRGRSPRRPQRRLAPLGRGQHRAVPRVAAPRHGPPGRRAGGVVSTVAVVVGNPKPQSRTLAAATYLARELVGEPDLVVDLADLGPAVLDWADPQVSDLVKQVGAADLVVFACPTYKAAYTGLLKLFLDRFAGGTGLSGVAVPLMLGGSPAHSLAPELLLRPVLTEIGGTVPGRGLYVVDAQHDDPAAYAGWLTATKPSSTPS